MHRAGRVQAHVDALGRVAVLLPSGEAPGYLVSKNLGAKAYYSALNDCTFVIGNSSSGVIEAPYFNKVVLLKLGR